MKCLARDFHRGFYDELERETSLKPDWDKLCINLRHTLSRQLYRRIASGLELSILFNRGPAAIIDKLSNEGATSP